MSDNEISATLAKLNQDLDRIQYPLSATALSGRTTSTHLTPAPPLPLPLPTKRLKNVVSTYHWEQIASHLSAIHKSSEMQTRYRQWKSRTQRQRQVKVFVEHLFIGRVAALRREVFSTWKKWYDEIQEARWRQNVSLTLQAKSNTKLITKGFLRFHQLVKDKEKNRITSLLESQKASARMHHAWLRWGDFVARRKIEREQHRRSLSDRHFHGSMRYLKKYTSLETTRKYFKWWQTWHTQYKVHRKLGKQIFNKLYSSTLHTNTFLHSFWKKWYEYTKLARIR
eukprot:PhF_6_TR37790/c0_g1_i3/m.56262